jgi:hypothetical protein
LFIVHPPPFISPYLLSPYLHYLCILKLYIIPTAYTAYSTLISRLCAFPVLYLFIHEVQVDHCFLLASCRRCFIHLSLGDAALMSRYISECE